MIRRCDPATVPVALAPPASRRPGRRAALTFGGLLLLGGRAGDILGRRRVFIAGIIVFSLASLFGGFATTQAWLLAARALQGAGGAIVAPTALSLITTNFPEGPPRNRAVGVYSAMSIGGIAAGLLAGGLLTSYLSWRWVLFVNVPIRGQNGTTQTDRTSAQPARPGPGPPTRPPTVRTSPPASQQGGGLGRDWLFALCPGGCERGSPGMTLAGRQPPTGKHLAGKAMDAYAGWRLEPNHKLLGATP